MDRPLRLAVSLLAGLAAASGFVLAAYLNTRYHVTDTLFAWVKPLAFGVTRRPALIGGSGEATAGLWASVRFVVVWFVGPAATVMAVAWATYRRLTDSSRPSPCAPPTT